MRKILLITALLFTTILTANEVHWAKDFKSGIEQANKEHKPVLFIISSHSCKYCLLLDKTTLHDAKVVDKLNKNFVSIRSWVDYGDYIPMELRQNTPGLPGIWFLYPDGKPIYQPLLGYVRAENFAGALDIVEKEFKKTKMKVK